MRGTTDPLPFELNAGHPALDFVNTLDNRFRDDGPVELLESYGDLLRFMQQTSLLSARQTRLLIDWAQHKGVAERALQSARALREAMAAVFYSGVDDVSSSSAVMRTLEEHFLRASQHRELRWRQSRLKWEWGRHETELELPVWILALSASELMTSDAMDRVRSCNSEACRWLFLDASRNHSRRWCTMKICGNRMKARRFQARREE